MFKKVSIFVLIFGVVLLAGCMENRYPTEKINPDEGVATEEVKNEEVVDGEKSETPGDTAEETSGDDAVGTQNLVSDAETTDPLPETTDEPTEEIETCGTEEKCDEVSEETEEDTSS